ncbi:non-ribosomal peptide synthetase/MFS transporter [Streptosporangium roseum]|uniref:Non-ribosomal peptide synthetase modules and related protein-like protein n=1 Tax=Streptosporangium roseum (strain ATCC 12428 / DSM 43021 / JCM 3005 / KCTC 9067 / NCIMB 10171 / NRRL 2505 / NI 9100) TaxID=479432 RepID=D2BDI4_STRRD|nr:non-ribosomal peptide synthetase/MFS transporter [Streptosporangium roseum]ACZ86273.1 Non-ribosomal peptide synthetase modules and related protein-like protein [Streptosporangium roseum DSM 43021]
MTISDERRSALAARLSAARRTAARTAPAIPAREATGGPAPLSPAQARLWFLAQLDDRAAYNVPAAVRLRGPLDTAALLGAVRDLADRHEVLRSLVTDEGATPVDADRVPITVEDLDDHDLLEARLQGELARPFALDSEPPARALLLRLTGADEHVLALTVHHIAFDAWSRNLALAELAALYAARLGMAEPPAPPKVQYADYAAWLAGRPEGDLAWWTGRLAGLEPVLDLPVDRARPSIADWSGAAVPLRLAPALTARVRGVAAETGCTPFMVLLAAWQELLGRISGTDDVPVGVPEAGRLHPDTAHMLGCFVNTLVLRGDRSGEPTGRELLVRTKDAVLDALTHRDVPFERIVEHLHPERSLATTPIFQALLNVLDDRPQALDFPGLTAEQAPPPPRTTKYDLNLAFVNEGEEYDGELTYRTDLFDGPTARRMAGWYLNLLEGMLADLDAPAAAVPLEPVSGPAVAGARTRMDLTRPLHAVIGDRARRTPEATAVVDASGSLTYGEVDRLANRLARHLTAAGVRPDEPVGVLVDRRSVLVPALLGVLRAGGAYMPMEPAYPDDRLAYMMETAGARVVLADREHAGRVPGTLVLPDLLAAGPDDPVEVDVTPGHLAHVIFTSGSTGRPKGAAIEHRSALHYLHGLAELVPDVHSSYGVVSTIASDLVLTCLYGALVRGAAVHLVDQDAATDPEAYAAYLAAHPVDVIKMVPSHLELLAAHGDLARMLPRRLLILAGEATSWELAERVRAAGPDLEVQIHCGPTETMVSVLGGRVPDPPSRSGSVPLGRPLAGVDCYVVDAASRPLPAGVPGELWVAGPSLARGYLNRPDLTAERFVPDPVAGIDRCYRTGDRVRLNSAGLVEFLGRVDDQVKIRGFRVELGEVKAALQEQPGVREAAVLPVGEGRSRRLAAWVAPASVDLAVIRAGLRERLPDYMVPPAIVVLDELPLTPLGKVDRARLPIPEAAPAAERVAPSTPTEVRIAAVWADILDVEVGVDDDFFALGGDSFRAVRAVREIDPSLRVIDLFTRPTVRELAAHLDGGAEAPAGLLHRLAGPRTASRTVICLPYGGGSAAAYQPLATALTRSCPTTAVLAVELPGHDPARPDEAMLPMPELVDRIVAELAGISGPIVLYGHCVGSAAATELALRLEASGTPVTGVFVGGSFPDARLPGRLSAWWNRRFPAHRWASDRTQRDFLRTLGALDEDFGDTGTMLRGLRHDVEEAQAWFSRHLDTPAGEERRLAAPLLCVIGERDRATELYQERYREWGAFADRVGLATIPRAGHYFIKHQAEPLARHISEHLDRWAGGDLPEPVGEVEVAGRSARRDLRRFYTVAAGQTVSLLGAALTSFALGVWAYQESGRVLDYALVSMLALLPSLLAAPLGGAVADRVDRRRVMLVCDGVSAAATAALVILLWLGRLEVWQVGIIAGLLSLVTAFHRPAYLAAVAQLVPKPYLMQANAVANLGTGLGMLIGPLGGAALIALVGLHGVVAVNIVTFLAGLGTLLLVRFPDRLFYRLEESFGQAIVGGWRFLVRRRPLMIMIGFFVVMNYLNMLALAVTVPAVLSFGDVAGVGAVTAMQGVGAVLGSLVMVFWGGTERRAIGMVGFVIGFGAGVLLVGLRPSLALAAFGGLMSWVFLTVLNAHWLALIQLKVGLELQGRVLATNQMLAVSMTPLAFLTAPSLADDVFGPLLVPGGALADTLVGDVVGVGPGRGAGLLLVVCGALLMLWGALGLWYRPLRRMEDALPDAVAGAEIADDLDAVQVEADAVLLEDAGRRG